MVKFPIIGLDIGSKRIGVAFMGQLSAAADFRKTLLRKGNAALEEILQLVTVKGIKVIIAGFPLDASGNRTEQCDDVENFCRRIERRIPIEIIFFDEYLTSIEAAETNAKSTGGVDDGAAEIILKRFLISKGLLPDYL